MSIPKEKLIIQEIKILIEELETRKISLDSFYQNVKYQVRDYEDPGYITGPIVGIPEGPES